MKPEELRALQDDIVHGECLETGVADGVTWEVRQHAKRAPWRPGDGWSRPVEVVAGQYRITMVLPLTARLKLALACPTMIVVAGRVASAIADAGPEYPAYMLIGTTVPRASLAEAIVSAREWCSDAAERGYTSPSP